MKWKKKNKNARLLERGEERAVRDSRGNTGLMKAKPVSRICVLREEDMGGGVGGKGRGQWGINRTCVGGSGCGGGVSKRRSIHCCEVTNMHCDTRRKIWIRDEITAKDMFSTDFDNTPSSDEHMKHGVSWALGKRPSKLYTKENYTERSMRTTKRIVWEGGIGVGDRAVTSRRGWRRASVWCDRQGYTLGSVIKKC